MENKGESEKGKRYEAQKQNFSANSQRVVPGIASQRQQGPRKTAEDIVRSDHRNRTNSASVNEAHGTSVTMPKTDNADHSLAGTRKQEVVVFLFNFINGPI